MPSLPYNIRHLIDLQDFLTFKSILKKVFEQKDISNILIDYTYQKKGAIYLYINKIFEYNASGFHKKVIDLPNWNTSMAHIFDLDNHEVFCFGGVMEFGSFTNGEVDTVVVLDHVRFKNGRVSVLLHTTNLNSNSYGKNKVAGKFARIECLLILKNSNWDFKKIKISDFAFKSILDDE